MFYTYAIFLTLSGIVMLAMALVRANYAKRRRGANFIFGAIFTIYGLYLLFAFNGGHYLIFYYAFALPVLLVIQFFRARSAAKKQAMSLAGNWPPAPADSAAAPEAGNSQV